jgi:hypothetical protein
MKITLKNPKPGAPLPTHNPFSSSRRSGCLAFWGCLTNQISSNDCDKISMLWLDPIPIPWKLSATFRFSINTISSFCIDIFSLKWFFYMHIFHESVFFQCNLSIFDRSHSMQYRPGQFHHGGTIKILTTLKNGLKWQKASGHNVINEFNIVGRGRCIKVEQTNQEKRLISWASPWPLKTALRRCLWLKH